MIQLVYISTATNNPSSSDLIEILEQARSRNLRQRITGMLLYSNNTYLQLLEGDANDVHDLYESISRDSRNEGHVILGETEIINRRFPDWSMGFQNLDSISPEDVQGYVEIFGGSLDKSIAENNKTNAVKMLLNFAPK